MITESLAPYLNTLEPDAVDRVISSINSTREGRAKDLVTPIIGKSSLDFDQDRARYRDLLLPKAMSNYELLNEVEHDQSLKIGAYSIQLPFEERKAQVASYFREKPLSYNRAGLDAAVSTVSKLMPRGLRPVSTRESFFNLPKGTNQGAPFFSADPEFRYETLKLAQEAEDVGYTGYREDDACMLYWRGQPQGIGKDPKQRTVWGYPHWLTVAELRIQMALLEYLRVFPEFSAWNGVQQVDDTITSMINRARNPLLSVDFSGFDASVPGVLIDAAFELIKGSFVPSAYRLIDLIHDRFKHIRLITPEGIWSGRDGAVPSGSGVTNLVDSIIHMILAQYCAWVTRNTIEVTTQGDDGVWLFTRPWNLDDVELCVEDFGMSMSSDKGGISLEAVYFLQNIHLKEYAIQGKYVGIRPLMRVLNGMLSYERLSQSWSAYDDSIRWMQQIESAKNHPKFSILVEFLYGHDKFARSMTPQEIVRKGGGIAQIARDLKQDGFPYGKAPLNGLYQFAVVKELARLKSSSGHARKSAA